MPLVRFYTKDADEPDTFPLEVIPRVGEFVAREDERHEVVRVEHHLNEEIQIGVWAREEKGKRRIRWV